MNYSDFVFLLGRQRSGTNALRSILETHPEICCLNEVFSATDRNSEYPELHAINFFNFVNQQTRRVPDAFCPDNHKRLFLDFLEYWRVKRSRTPIGI
jgi:hypothetical protein